MTQRSPYLVNRAFRSYLAATVMSTMAVSFGTMLGSIVVGNVMGPTALGAVNVMMPIIQLLAALNALINIGGATVMAVNVGRGRTDEVRGIFTKSMLMSLTVSVAIAAVGILFIDDVMSLLCTDPELMGMAREYGLLVFAMSPLFVIMPGLGAYVRTDNSPRLAMASFIAMNATDLVLSFVFMEYLDMGLTGFALGTGIGYVVGLAVLVPHFLGRERTIGVGKGTVRCSEILTMGAPTALGMGMIMVNMLGINLLVMDNLGSDGMAIRSVCTNVQMISSIFVSGISQTLQPVGGSLYGSEDLTGMRIVIGIATRYQLAVAAAITLVTLAVPTVFLTLYGVTDPSIHDVAVEDLRLFAPYILFQAANYFIMVIYQVFGHRPIALSISVMECAFILVGSARSSSWQHTRSHRSAPISSGCPSSSVRPWSRWSSSSCRWRSGIATRSSRVSPCSGSPAERSWTHPCPATVPRCRRCWTRSPPSSGPQGLTGRCRSASGSAARRYS